MLRLSYAVALVIAWLVPSFTEAAEEVATLDVAPVWAGHPVGFCLLTEGKRQYVAYYDAQRRMTVAQRTIDSSRWQFTVLPTSVGWDSHNFVTMTLDRDGYLHVSGNMHCVPLIYFRSKQPYDAATLERVEAMVGRNEQKCTYPRFFRGAKDELIFTYRDGRSGSGDQILNAYDLVTRSWRRLLDAPLFAGGGKMNAYPILPVRDAKGTFHICWVWRNTPDCATNHDISYARSRDLVNWETSDGKPLTLPITVATGEIIDPIPPGGGLINSNQHLGFDAKGRVIVSYHKHDAAGKTQIYDARREADGWKIYQTSDWDYRWEFSGGGTIRGEIGLGPVTLVDGKLTQTYRHAKFGSGNWQLDETTLKPLGQAPRQAAGGPRSLAKVESKFPGIEVRWASDIGRSDEAKVRYLLRWETLPTNRDRPHPGDPPPPSTLRVVRMSE